MRGATGLLDRKVVEALKRFEETDIFFRGYVAWSGFKQFELDYAPEPRCAGETEYTFTKLLRLALSSPPGFSIPPLRLVILGGPTHRTLFTGQIGLQQAAP